MGSLTARSQDPLEGEPVSDEVAADLDILRGLLVRAPAPEVAAEHLARLTGDAGRALRDEGEPAHLDERADRRRIRRQRWAVAAVASVGVVIGTGSLAAAGVLPSAVQDVVADVARPFGLDLPHSGDGPDGGDSPTSTSTTTGGVSEGAPGSSGEAPGQSGGAPGQLGEAPGQSGDAPGQGGSSPGQSGDAPGQSGVAPGQSGGVPGQGGSSPGQSGDAPGQSGVAPGQSGGAPGQGGSSPGQSGGAPGQSGGAPGQGGSTPGQSDEPPGQWAADDPNA